MPQKAPGIGRIRRDIDPFYRFFGLIQECILITEGRKQEAAALLASKLETAESAGWTYGVIAVHVLQTLAAEDQEAAMRFLTETLDRSHEQGFIRIYADCGQDLSPLLLEAAQRGVYPEYVGQILAAIGDKPDRETTLGPQIERLSERELEVLRLVSAGLSNREIAAKLYLSPGTVKTHVHNICGKLGASNRTQAVMRARDLDLI
jgi:LuxR family maltose regulon positive regulatory protein